MFGDLYEIVNAVSEGDTIQWNLRLNAGSSIYRAHFPGSPVTPGACQIEIARQMAESFMGRPVFVAEVRNVKFLKVMDPRSVGEVCLTGSLSSVEEDGSKFNVTFASATDTYTKMTLIIR